MTCSEWICHYYRGEARLVLVGTQCQKIKHLHGGGGVAVTLKIQESCRNQGNNKQKVTQFICHIHLVTLDSGCEGLQNREGANKT